MDLSQYSEIFLAESKEHLGVINGHLLEWELNPEATEPVDAIFRAMHTIKGMAATMGYQLTADLAHRSENLLDAIRKGGDAPDDALPSPFDLGSSEPSGGSGSYLVQGGKWPQPGGLGTPVSVTYSYSNLLDGGLLQPNGQPLPRWLIRQSVEDAFGLWASVAPLHFVEVEDQGGPVQIGMQYPAGQFGQITVCYQQGDPEHEAGQRGARNKRCHRQGPEGVPRPQIADHAEDDREQSGQHRYVEAVVPRLPRVTHHEDDREHREDRHRRDL